MAQNDHIEDWRKYRKKDMRKKRGQWKECQDRWGDNGNIQSVSSYSYHLQVRSAQDYQMQSLIYVYIYLIILCIDLFISDHWISLSVQCYHIFIITNNDLLAY